MTSVDAVMAVTDVDEVVVPEKDRSLSQLIESNTYIKDFHHVNGI